MSLTEQGWSLRELDPEDGVRFEQLVVPHAAFHFAPWLLRRREGAEDVAQEALLRTCRFSVYFMAGMRGLS